MALYSKKEFASRCGMTTNALAVYVKRGKVILTGDMIDEEMAQNQVFIASRSVKAAAAPPSGVRTPSRATHAPSSRGRKGKEPSAPGASRSFEGAVSKSFEVDLERKQIDKERAELARRMLETQLGRTSGKLVPMESIRFGLEQHWRDLTVAMRQAAQNIVVNIGHKAKLNLNQKAELNEMLVRELNDMINRAINATQDTLRKIQKENSDKLGDKAA